MGSLPDPDFFEKIFKTEIQTPLPEPIVRRALSQAPFVSVPGIFNIRDISNVNTSHSLFPPIVRPGLIFRSGAPPTIIADETKAALASLGITRIFDLRRQIERENKPSPQIEGVENVWVPYAVEEPPPNLDNFVADVLGSFTRMYMRYLETHAPIYKLIFEHIRDRPQEPLLYHCSAGKDRTGVITALILRIAGCSDEAIVHDYMLSRVGVEPARPALVALVKAHHGDVVVGDVMVHNPGAVALFGVQAQGMVDFLKFLDESHENGATGYLKTKMGFSDQDLAVIRDNLRLVKGFI